MLSPNIDHFPDLEVEVLFAFRNPKGPNTDVMIPSAGQSENTTLPVENETGFDEKNSFGEEQKHQNSN